LEISTSVHINTGPRPRALSTKYVKPSDDLAGSDLPPTPSILTIRRDMEVSRHVLLKPIDLSLQPVHLAPKPLLLPRIPQAKTPQSLELERWTRPKTQKSWLLRLDSRTSKVNVWELVRAPAEHRMDGRRRRHSQACWNRWLKLSNPGRPAIPSRSVAQRTNPPWQRRSRHTRELQIPGAEPDGGQWRSRRRRRSNKLVGYGRVIRYRLPRHRADHRAFPYLKRAPHQPAPLSIHAVRPRPAISTTPSY
jgi:hypothetical protein